MIREHHGVMPVVHKDAFVAETAVLIGEVEVGANSSIWFGAILRGDINHIKIGERTSIQDNCVVHVDSDKPTEIGDDVTIGHGAIIHGCKIGNTALIGMGATILDGAVIGEGAIIAANALVLENRIIPPNTLAAGIPAKEKRKFDDSMREKLKRHASLYVEYSKTY